VLARPYLFAKDASLAEAACTIFTERGGIDAVEMLHAIAASDRRPNAIRVAARNAIVAIQSRSGRSPSHGGLMLTDAQPIDGALSTIRRNMTKRSAFAAPLVKASGIVEMYRPSGSGRSARLAPH